MFHELFPRLQLVHTGVRAFVRNEGSNEQAFRYRLQSDGLAIIAPLLSKARIVNVQLDDIRALILHQNPLIDNLTVSTRDHLDNLRKWYQLLI